MFRAPKMGEGESSAIGYTFLVAPQETGKTRFSRCGKARVFECDGGADRWRLTSLLVAKAATDPKLLPALGLNQYRA